MSLFFIRHTQSEANVQDILGGQADYPLTETGIRDARSIADGLQATLKQENIHQIISSPLIRAVQTAEAMAPVLGLSQTCLEPLLMEQDMGRFTSLSYAQLEHEPDYVHDRRQRWDWQPAPHPQESDWQGESYAQIATRVTQFFRKLDTGGQNILIVSHAVTLRLVYGYLRDMFPQYLENIPQNGEIWRVEDIEPNKDKLIRQYYFQGSRESRA